MRYLRRYDEAKLTDNLTTEMVDELRTFCRNYLVELIDIGYHIKVTPAFSETSCNITLDKPEMTIMGYPVNVKFKFSDIKDSFITFIHMLETDYIIEEIKVIGGFSSDFRIVVIDDLESLDYNKMYKASVKVSFKL